MVAFTGFRMRPKSGIDAIPVAPSRAHPARQRSSSWMIWTALALALALAAGPALSQAGVALIKVDLSVVSKGYRMSKLIGTTVINDKNEKIGQGQESAEFRGAAGRRIPRPRRTSRGGAL
jgi:hypothetical protein